MRKQKGWIREKRQEPSQEAQDKLGGGILVLSGGYVTMESGQISMCSAPTRSKQLRRCRRGGQRRYLYPG